MSSLIKLANMLVNDHSDQLIADTLNISLSTV